MAVIRITGHTMDDRIFNDGLNFNQLNLMAAMILTERIPDSGHDIDCTVYLMMTMILVGYVKMVMITTGYSTSVGHDNDRKFYNIARIPDGGHAMAIPSPRYCS